MIQLSTINGKTTLIKAQPVQSSELPDNLKFPLYSGQQIDIVADSLDQINSHYKFELKDPVNGIKTWYAFVPHVTIISSKPELSIELNVPYFSQRDNRIRPHQTCNMTCGAMVIKYFYPDTKSQGQLEDEMTQYAVKKWGHDAIYYPNLISATLNHYGVSGNFGDYTFDEMKQHLLDGNPIIHNGRYTQSGHFVVIKGFNQQGFIINDPWGEWFASGYQNKSGANILYSYNLISNVSFIGRNKGRCHLTKRMEKP
jgi:uncharacterized protein YvpB